MPFQVTTNCAVLFVFVLLIVVVVKEEAVAFIENK